MGNDVNSVLVALEVVTSGDHSECGHSDISGQVVVDGVGCDVPLPSLTNFCI